MVETREQTIQWLESIGCWNEETVSRLDAEYVNVVLDLYRFAKAEADAMRRLKAYEMRKALVEMIEHPRVPENIQEVNADLGLFTRKKCNHDK